MEEQECPMCGRTSTTGDWYTLVSTDPVMLQNQIDNLDRTLENLKSGEESVLSLLEDHYEMCPMCDELLDGIEDESGKKLLENRINTTVEHLEERLENMLPGQL